MNNKLFIRNFLVILTVVLVSQMSFIYADKEKEKGDEDKKNEFTIQLPDTQLYAPDLDVGTDGAAGIISVINIVIGIAGAIVLATIGPAVLKEIIPLIQGKSSLSQIGGRLKAIGVSIFAVILTLTGAWVPILFFMWNKILVRMINAFLSS